LNGTTDILQSQYNYHIQFHDSLLLSFIWKNRYCYTVCVSKLNYIFSYSNLCSSYGAAACVSKKCYTKNGKTLKCTGQYKASPYVFYSIQFYFYSKCILICECLVENGWHVLEKRQHGEEWDQLPWQLSYHVVPHQHSTNCWHCRCKCPCVLFA
jgi:hypothetical protein